MRQLIPEHYTNSIEEFKNCNQWRLIYRRSVAEVSIKSKTEENIQENIQPVGEVLKKKIAATKTLDNEIVDLKTKIEHIEQIINEGTEFEIYCKTKLNILNKF